MGIAETAIERIKATKEVLVVILSLVSSLSVALNHLRDISGFFYEHTLAILFILWIVSVYWTFPTQKTKRPGYPGIRYYSRRYFALVSVTLVYGFTASWFIWETRFRHVDGVIHVRAPGAHLQIHENWISRANARQSAPLIQQFDLIKDQTTFIEKDDELDFSEHAKEGVRVARSFGMNPKWFNKNKNPGGCMDGLYEKFAYDALDGDVATMHAFTYYLKKFNKQNLLPYLEHIIIGKSRRPDIENNNGGLYPSSAELNAMRQDTAEANGPEHAAVIVNWIKYCVGIPYPVFRITVSNTDTSRALQLTSIDYVVHDIGGYAAGEPGLFVVIPSYVFPIEYKRGLQTNPIVDPIFNIRPGETGSFNLTIFNNSDNAGLTWKMKISSFPI